MRIDLTSVYSMRD
jgi:hypothetical protein